MSGSTRLVLLDRLLKINREFTELLREIPVHDYGPLHEQLDCCVKAFEELHSQISDKGPDPCLN